MSREFPLSSFGIDPSKCTVAPLGTGLINSTWKVTDTKKNIKFVLQQINRNVFKKPADIDHNLSLLKRHLEASHSNYLFISPVESIDGQGLVKDELGEFFRMFPYVQDSKTLTSLSQPEHAYEAAKQFGMFTRAFAELDISSLRITIPDFHNLSMRFENFKMAAERNPVNRNSSAQDEIRFLYDNASIVTTYEKIISSPDFIRRVTHHDTKISNVLFDQNNKGICVIDLDTTMPGIFISDVGDMFRTYLSNANEEEKELDKIEVRPIFFQAIADGYLDTMGTLLTKTELSQFLYAGYFLIYMQAIRFLADYISGDIYYTIQYDGHNLLRARNQIKLLRSFQRLEPELMKFLTPRKYY